MQNVVILQGTVFTFQFLWAWPQILTMGSVPSTTEGTADRPQICSPNISSFHSKLMVSRMDKALASCWLRRSIQYIVTSREQVRDYWREMDDGTVDLPHPRPPLLWQTPGPIILSVGDWHRHPCSRLSMIFKQYRPNATLGLPIAAEGYNLLLSLSQPFLLPSTPSVSSHYVTVSNLSARLSVCRLLWLNGAF